MLSVSSKYALRALLYLSENADGEYLPVEQVAQESSVSPTYLSKLFKILAAANLVETKRGAQGGVRLVHESITFFEVCEALKDPVLVEICFLSNSLCSEKSPCEYHERWSRERARIISFLKALTITA